MVTTSDYISLREMIVNVLAEQGITTRIAAGDTSIDFKELTPEQAQELISEDGYFGGILPDISMKTYDAVMEKLDAGMSEK